MIFYSRIFRLELRRRLSEHCKMNDHLLRDKVMSRQGTAPLASSSFAKSPSWHQRRIAMLVLQLQDFCSGTGCQCFVLIPKRFRLSSSQNFIGKNQKQIIFFLEGTSDTDVHAGVVTGKKLNTTIICKILYLLCKRCPSLNLCSRLVPCIDICKLLIYQCGEHK